MHLDKMLSKGLLYIFFLNVVSGIAVASPRVEIPNLYDEKYDVDISLDELPDSSPKYYRDSNDVDENSYEENDDNFNEMNYAERALNDDSRRTFHRDSNDIVDFYDDKNDVGRQMDDDDRSSSRKGNFEKKDVFDKEENDEDKVNDYSNKWQCVRKYTRYNSKGGGQTWYLDRHDVRCDPNKALLSFKLERSRGLNSKIRYQYTCCNLPTRCQTVQDKKTPANSDGRGRTTYLGRHAVQCNNNFITKFRLTRPSRRKISYKYGCCAAGGTKTCYSDSTPFNSDGRGNTIFLDRHFVKCRDNHILTYFGLQRRGNQYRYNFKCCTVAGGGNKPKPSLSGSFRCLRSPRTVTKNTQLFTIPVWPKSFNILFYIRPTGIVYNQYANIMHFTHDGRDWATYGSRIPGIWFLPGTTRLHIGSAINGDLNNYFNTAKALPLNKNTQVLINQARKSNDQYVYSIHIDQEKVFEVINTDAREFRNVQVFVSDRFRPAASATIFGLAISSGAPGLPINPGNTFCPCIHSRTSGAKCPSSQRTTPFRRLDGSCNNLDNPSWGASNTPLRRLVAADYVDGITIPRGFPGTNPKVPTADEVSRAIFKVEKQNVGNGNGLAVVFMTFGQFLDHDLTEVRMDPGCRLMHYGSCANIQATFQYPCFPIIRSASSTKCTRFPRSEAVCPQSGKETTTIRQQPNELTAFVDASQIYSPNVTHARILRTLKGGEMKVTSDGLMPVNTIPFGFGACSVHENVNGERPVGCRTLGGCSLVGDTRGDENIALHTMHTLWLREHNRIARQLRTMNNMWSDEMIYQNARKIVGAEWAHITYEEYLPKLMKIKPYKGYDSKVDPSILNSFAAAAFRYGHSLIPNFFELNNANFDPTANSPVLLQDAFFNREIINFLGIESTMFGLTGNQSNAVDNAFAESVARKLFVRPDENFESDLLALNIQRGRDHGIPTYGAYRKVCGLSEINTWEQLKQVMLPSAVEGFKKIYDTPGNIDLFAAGISEKHVPGFELGETFGCLIGRQFEASRDGDRFFYLNRNPEVFTSAQLNSIKRVTFASILCENLKGIVSIQPKALSVPGSNNKRVSCSQIKRLDLNSWRMTGSDKDETMESFHK